MYGRTGFRYRGPEEKKRVHEFPLCRCRCTALYLSGIPCQIREIRLFSNCKTADNFILFFNVRVLLNKFLSVYSRGLIHPRDTARRANRKTFYVREQPTFQVSLPFIFTLLCFFSPFCPLFFVSVCVFMSSLIAGYRWECFQKISKTNRSRDRM